MKMFRKLKLLVATVVVNIVKRSESIYYTPESNVSHMIQGGAIVGEDCHIYGQCRVDIPALLKIGSNVTISQNVRFLMHDASTKRDIGYSKVGKIVIGDNCFVGIDSTIMPGTVIGDNVIVGTSTVVRGKIPSNSVVVGNPGVVVCTKNDYIEKQRCYFENEGHIEGSMDEFVESDRISGFTS